MSQRFSLESLEARLLLSADTGSVFAAQLVSDPTVIEMFYDMPALVVEQLPDGQGLSRVSMNGAESWGDVGEAILPIVPAQIVLPYGYALAGVEVIAGELIDLAGSYQLELGEEHAEHVALAEGEVVSADTGLGSAGLFEVAGVGRRRGVSILTVLLNPVEYTPQTGLVSYYDSLTLRVDLAEDNSLQQIRYQPDEIMPLTTGVDNPDALASYDASVYESSMAPLSSGIVNPADSYDYVIITNDALATASADYDMGDFITHKQALGFDITMVTVEDIYANYTGTDPQEQVRNFIIDAYNSWGLDYVLIGGDPSIVPMRDMHIDEDKNGGAPYFNPAVASDVYYQCLDGTFDYNGNGLYGQTNDGPTGGEVDWLAEVYIGRGAFDTVERMSNWVYKTITYENSVSDPFRYTAEMVGEYVGFGGISDYAKPFLEEIRFGTSSAGYTTAGFASDPSFSVGTLYDKDGTWPVSSLIADINNNEYAIYNGLGHGSGGQVMKMTLPGIDSQLTNDKFFFIYSQACWPAYMYGDSIAEHLTTYTRNGAAAVVMNTNFGWGANYSTDGISQRLNRQFWDALFTYDIAELGAMNAYSHEMWSLPSDPVGDNCWDWTVTRVVKYGTVLLGDPSLKIISMDMAIATDADLPIAYQDEYYDVTLETRNGTGPYTWSVTAGDLPDGLALNASTGVISGTPTGTLDETFTVEVLDTFDSSTDSKEFNLTVVDRLELLVTELSAGHVDVYYNVDLAVEGGTAPYTWSITAGGLPDGLSLDVGTGLLDGTPTTAGSYVFTVMARDSDSHQQTVAQLYTMDVTVLAPGIYGQVFNDVNSNGQRDAGEVGLNGMTIEVVDLATGLAVGTTVSAAADSNGDSVFDPLLECGLYSFTGLPAGHYEVRQIAQAGWDSTTLVPYTGRLFSLRNVGSDLTINENDPETGLLLNSFPAPQTTMFASMQGLAVGLDSLFFIDSSNPAAAPVLYELNLETGAIIDSDTVSGTLPALTMGLGVIDCQVYVQFSMNEIRVFNCGSDTVTDVLTVSASLTGGLTAAPDMGLLFGSNSSGDIYAIDPSTGAVVNTFNPGVGSLNGGLAYHAGELIASPQAIDASNLVHRIDAVTGALLGTLELIGTGYVVGLGGESVAPPAYGVYRVRMEADSIVQGKDFGNAVQLLGDVDCDSDVDATDIDIVLGGFGDAGLIAPLCDLDADGDVDRDDADTLIRDILGTEYGDFNLDGLVDTTDLTRLATNFGTGTTWAEGNANGNIDLVIDTTDLTILSTYFGFDASAGDTLDEPAPLSAVPSDAPEPSHTPLSAATVEPVVEVVTTPVVEVAATTDVVVAATADVEVAATAVVEAASEPTHTGPRRPHWSRPSRVVRSQRAGRPMRFRRAGAVKSLAPSLELAAGPVQLTAPLTPTDSSVVSQAELDTGLVNVLDEVDALL